MASLASMSRPASSLRRFLFVIIPSVDPRILTYSDHYHQGVSFEGLKAKPAHSERSYVEGEDDGNDDDDDCTVNRLIDWPQPFLERSDPNPPQVILGQQQGMK